MNYGQANYGQANYAPARYSDGDLGWIGCAVNLGAGLIAGALLTFVCFALGVWFFASALWVASIYVGPVVALLLWIGLAAFMLPRLRRDGGHPAGLVFLGGLGAVPVTLGVIAGTVWLLYALAT
ncbi:hypothetical protein [Nocardia sp. NPDC127526]|uniref:hypothetical protein n=1 Tax=Nocardia sp. NPDC127526 TaxID=3345393 RepID=UPI003631BD06